MILGKRARSFSDDTIPPSRVKKQARTEIFNDEEENPFITRTTRTKAQNADSIEVDDVTGSRTASPKLRRAASRNTSKPKVLSTSLFNGALKTTLLRDTTRANKLEDENQKPIQIPTPQTPRHRDAQSKKIPTTPRHRVIVAGKPFTPQTPRTPVTPGGLVATIYSKARQVFARSNVPGRLIGREAEKEELTTFIQERINGSCGGCIYVSGPPGTGKSAMVSEVTSDFEEEDTLKKVYINCMSIKTSKDLYGNLIDNMCGDLDILEGQETKALHSIFVPRKKNQATYVVTLDEIDHILTLDLEILYKLFEWSLQKSSRLVLIGIANALDLTDRFLPRLKARNLKPQLLPFLPYTATQIKTVIITRLKSLVPSDSTTPDYVPFLHPGAIELCSRKVSSQTGDLRKAFDICRRAIDLIETETKLKHEQALIDEVALSSPSKRPLEEIANDAAPSPKKAKSVAQSLSTLTVESAPRALISHLNKITSTTLSAGSASRLKTLNLQQKAALCALIALEKNKRDAAASLIPSTPSKTRIEAPTVKQLYAVYCMLCKKDSILHPLTGTEFRDVVGSLETMGLVGGVDARGTAGKRVRKFGAGVGTGDEKRVASCVGEKEVAIAVEGLGAGILKSILSGEGLD